MLKNHAQQCNNVDDDDNDNDDVYGIHKLYRKIIYNDVYNILKEMKDYEYIYVNLKSWNVMINILTLLNQYHQKQLHLIRMINKNIR